MATQNLFVHPFTSVLENGKYCDHRRKRYATPTCIRLLRSILSSFKVNVSVNGHPIPFNMKIGEAGEAFFVFETDGDVPDDLITSPILHPTRPNDSTGADSLAVKGTELEPTLQPDDQDITRAKNDESAPKQSSDDQEPDFLDLDAQPSKSVQVGESLKNLDSKYRLSPSSLLKTGDCQAFHHHR